MKPNGTLITSEFTTFARHHFKLDWHGIHGAPHWARVRRNGLRLAKTEGANARVIEYFAFTHDLCRKDDFVDPYHGQRAAELVSKLNGKLIFLNDHELGLLQEACTHHSDGLTDADVTVQCCWDADRLDLPRVGVRVNPARLCTNSAVLLCKACI